MPPQRDVLFRVGGAPWAPPATSGYGSEQELQLLLADQPGLLPGVEDGAHAVTEFSTQVGPSDIVAVGPAGDLTIVECKLASNDEARRKIVGQVLDYAARLWAMPRREFESRWIARSGPAFDSWLDAAGLEALETNLRDGRFRLILAVDEISEDLRRLVEYLNAHTAASVQVLAVELNIASAGDVDVLIPTVYGVELVESAGKELTSQRRPKWTRDEVLDWLRQNQVDEAEAVESLLDQLEQVGCWVEGTSAQTPSLVVGMKVPEGKVYPFSIYTGATKQTFSVNFEWIARRGLHAQERFLQAVASVLPSLSVAEIRDSSYRRRPGVPVGDLTSDGVVAALVAATADLRIEPAGANR